MHFVVWAPSLTREPLPAAAQDELRRFRVRSDALTRQKDTELAAAKDTIVQVRSRVAVR